MRTYYAQQQKKKKRREEEKKKKKKGKKKGEERRGPTLRYIFVLRIQPNIEREKGYKESHIYRKREEREREGERETHSQLSTTFFLLVSSHGLVWG